MDKKFNICRSSYGVVGYPEELQGIECPSCGLKTLFVGAFEKGTPNERNHVICGCGYMQETPCANPGTAIGLFLSMLAVNTTPTRG